MFEVGDIVKVREDLDISMFNVVEGMLQYKGKIAKIIDIDGSNEILIDLDNKFYDWSGLIYKAKSNDITSNYTSEYKNGILTLKNLITGKEYKAIKSEEDREDLEKAIMVALLKEQGIGFNTIKGILDKTKRKFKPKIGDKYYCSSSFLDIREKIFYDDFTDEQLLKAGNCFKTKEEAEEVLNKMKDIFK